VCDRERGVMLCFVGCDLLDEMARRTIKKCFISIFKTYFVKNDFFVDF
jgi:hypothetical protein